jgi:hypothetical protein
VQFSVTPLSVITTFAVAEPSYVITSRRVDVVGDCPEIAIVADIERVIEPAVGYGRVFVDDSRGMITPRTVSPTVRVAVNAPSRDVPVVVSFPDDALFTVRCVLDGPRPVTTWLLDELIVLWLLSRRVVVPETVAVVVTVFVSESNAGCDAPAVF